MATFKEMPQPKTFAPSKEDVLQNLQYFFGAPVSPEKLKDYSERKRPPTHTFHALRPARSPTPLVVHRPRHDVSFSGRLRRAEHQDVRPTPCPHPSLPLLTRLFLARQPRYA